MSDLDELYRDMIIEHQRHPRNYGTLETPAAKAEGFNPLCGDQVTVFVRLAGDRIEDIRFQGGGCAISQASASLMTATVKGKTREEAERLFGDFHELVMGRQAEGAKDLGKLEAFSGVSAFPARVKCATLAWHTLHSALEEASGAAGTTPPGPVSTE